LSTVEVPSRTIITPSETMVRVNVEAADTRRDITTHP